MSKRREPVPAPSRPVARWRRWAFAVLVVACPIGGAGVVLADAHTGPGVFGGLAVHQGNVQLATGASSGFVSSGVDGGAEYQFVLNPNWSLVGLVQTSAESVGGDAGRVYTLANHSIAGAGARYWEGPKFVGFHVGEYAEALRAKSGTGAKDTQASGWGFGLSWGWEGDAGWFTAGQLDLAEVAYTNATHPLTGVRVHLGYRWGRPQEL